MDSHRTNPNGRSVLLEFEKSTSWALGLGQISISLSRLHVNIIVTRIYFCFWLLQNRKRKCCVIWNMVALWLYFSFSSIPINIYIFLFCVPRCCSYSAVDLCACARIWLVLGFFLLFGYADDFSFLCYNQWQVYWAESRGRGIKWCIFKETEEWRPVSMAKFRLLLLLFFFYSGGIQRHRHRYGHGIRCIQCIQYTICQLCSRVRLMMADGKWKQICME